eukprot:1147737-Pelagomonas_calceolata.AAC.1
MAAGDYEAALPVALDAVHQGQSLFKPSPALQLFPLYLLAAQPSSYVATGCCFPLPIPLAIAPLRCRTHVNGHKGNPQMQSLNDVSPDAVPPNAVPKLVTSRGWPQLAVHSMPRTFAKVLTVALPFNGVHPFWVLELLMGFLRVEGQSSGAGSSKA